MRTNIAIATFMSVAAGAVGAHALSGIHFLGSDTLYEVTRDVIAACPAITNASFIYDGTGSGNGEKAMNLAASTQTVAPMSRFLNGGGTVAAPGAGCNTAASYTKDDGSGTVAASPTSAEGLVLGLDGVAIIGSSAATAACNGSVNDCDASTEANTGLAYNTTVAYTDAGVAKTYTFSGWRDVLRLVYGGADLAAGNDITKRACGSALRRAVVDNWGNLFQNNCAGGASCTSLRHAFRRDDASGTSDVLVAVLGLSSIDVPGKKSPFCNATSATDPVPAIGRYWADYEDQDPIRRTCAGTNNGATPSTTIATEQVCGRKSDLGVVLPIPPVDFLLPADALNANACVSSFIFGTAPKNLNNQTVRCPNGDSAVLGNQCLIPTDASGKPNCLAGKSTRPFIFGDNSAVDGVTPQAADGRVYNLHLYKADGTYIVDKKSPARQFQGAFNRIHTTRSMITPNNTLNSCTDLDASNQIPCLVQASPCSIGYAGRVAATETPNVVALKVAGLYPTTQCIQQFQYPLARKLYLNTTFGFDGVMGDELQLAKCMANSATINTALSTHGFIPLPATATNPTGAPFCEDFNETSLCPAGIAPAANTNACAIHNAAVGLPTVSTVCGNSVKEDFEECDCGTDAGALPAGCSGINGASTAPGTCSKTCRIN
ncbi:MAG TPA: hypothetical protein VIV60_14970 [Polyangiaceae bacterium]